MKVNNMPPPINATIVPPATNRNKIAPKFESMLPIEFSFRPLVKGRATVELRSRGSFDDRRLQDFASDDL